MEGLKPGFHKFNFGQCSASMAVHYDPRDGQVFVTDEVLGAMKTLFGATKARAISSASVIVDGLNLNLINGERHKDVLPFALQEEAFKAMREAATVISINRNPCRDFSVIEVNHKSLLPR